VNTAGSGGVAQPRAAARQTATQPAPTRATAKQRQRWLQPAPDSFDELRLLARRRRAAAGFEATPKGRLVSCFSPAPTGSPVLLVRRCRGRLDAVLGVELWALLQLLSGRHPIGNPLPRRHCRRPCVSLVGDCGGVAGEPQAASRAASANAVEIRGMRIIWRFLRSGRGELVQRSCRRKGEGSIRAASDIEGDDDVESWGPALFASGRRRIDDQYGYWADGERFNRNV